MAAKKVPSGRRYWLFKSEPSVYGWDHLVKDRRTHWDGVRNYQARNLLRDDIKVGDGVLFYHSNAKPTAVVGVAKVVKAGYPDHTALDKRSKYYDPDDSAENPRWYMVDIAPVRGFAEPLDRDRLKAAAALEKMMVLQRGSRLSVQPVTPAEWKAILRMGKLEVSW